MMTFNSGYLNSIIYSRSQKQLYVQSWGRGKLQQESKDERLRGAQGKVLKFTLQNYMVSQNLLSAFSSSLPLEIEG